MRQGIGCVLWQAGSGTLAQVRRDLEAWRFVCRTMDAKGADAPPTGEDLLVAQALEEGLVLVTADAMMRRYPVAWLW